MIILFLNLHKQTEQGNARFQRYHTSVTNVLKQSVYFGANFQQQIRTKDNLSDYLYDDFELNGQEKPREKFQSVSYIFIDGPINQPPWSLSLIGVSLLIRNALREGKKVHFNGFGHIASYYQISTGFEKDFIIRKKGESVTGKEDYLHDEETGDLYANGKKACSSGVQVSRNNSRFYHMKSVQAIQKGAVLPTKFHYFAFNSKNGDKLLEGISFPFTFFEKHKIFCVPLPKTRAKVTCLVETQDKIPIVFIYQRSLSTHLLTPQTTKILTNWIMDGMEVRPFRQIKIQSELIPEMAFNNFIQTKSSRMSNCFQTQRRSSGTLRVQTASSSKSKFVFEKPSVRCSGPYETLESIRNKQQIEGKSKLFGRSRMFFRSEMNKSEIKNFVQRTPSRPPSAHLFRDINKAKWLDKKTFFVT